MTSYNLLSDDRLSLGESPVWDAARQCLYAVDIDRGQIHRWRWGRREHKAWVLPQKVACVALTDRGTLLAAMEDSIAEVRLEGDRAALRTLATIEHPAPSMRFNDGRCDRSGRFWVGTMCTDAAATNAWGGLYCLDERGLTGPWVRDLRVPNGLAVSPDGATLYLSDSHPSVQQVWRMGLDAHTGELGPRQPFFDMRPLRGRPDGAAMDTHGCYWICGNDGAEVYAIDRTGRMVQTMPVPQRKPSMCSFGGPRLDTLIVASIDARPMDWIDPWGGSIVCCTVQARGEPEPIFSRWP
jgi:sugar lactone lactonase YvrE